MKRRSFIQVRDERSTGGRGSTWRDSTFVWKNFLRGNHPIVLDWGLTDRKDDRWESIRRAMGASRRLSERIDLAAMTPAGALASSGYCLAARGKAYLVYVPGGESVKIDLTDLPGKLDAQWIRAGDGETVHRQELSGGGKVAMAAPRNGNWLVYLNVRE